MPLIIKFLTKHTTPINDINIDFAGDLSLRLLYASFINLGINQDNIQDIRFIMNNIQLKVLDEKYNIKPTDQQVIYLICINQNIRDKLISIFNNTTQSKKDPEPIMTDSIIDNQNKITMKLFNDPDFRTLLKIYQTKPELFNILLQYTQSGDIVNENKEVKQISELTQVEIIKYNELLSQIKLLKLNIPDEEIMNVLIKYDGHLNLALRSILTKLLK